MNNPAKVILKVDEKCNEIEALMYAIIPDKNGSPIATCYIPERNLWMGAPVAFIRPILDDKESRQLNEKI